MTAPVLDPHQGIERLVENHRQFLRFLERRVGSREEAEDILQDAFVKGLSKLEGVRDDEALVPWFYRLLRNALVDHYRRRGVEARALDRVEREADASVPGHDAEVLDAVCNCVGALLQTLQPAYAGAIQRVELDGMAVREYAAEAGITPNNAAVRLHRARAALRQQLTRSCGTCAEHGCEDCTCKASGGKNSVSCA